MDTGTQGPPSEFVPFVKQLGFAGMSAHLGNARELSSLLPQNQLKLFTVYFPTTLDADQNAIESTPQLKPLLDSLAHSGTTLWLAIHRVVRNQAPLPKDAVPQAALLARLREITVYAAEKGVAVSLYPHAGFFLEKVEHALALTRELGNPNLTLTFNLCHWLKVEGDQDPSPVLREALPHLSCVTLQGADGGDTRSLSWKQLIQPIGQGSYPLPPLLRSLHQLGYSGPIGLQHFGVQGDWRENISQSMTGWQALP
jgi:sugar phosphate isomerase/epimerase